MTIYVAKPYENPFGNLPAIYLAIESPKTRHRRQARGQGRAGSADRPADRHLHRKPAAADRRHRNPLLRRPPGCPGHPADLRHQDHDHDHDPVVTPEGADAHPTDSFETTLARAAELARRAKQPPRTTPSFTAGTVAPLAGAYSPFLLKLGREDGTQHLTGIDTTLPRACRQARRHPLLPGGPDRPGAAPGKPRTGRPGAEQPPPAPPPPKSATVTVGAGSGITPLYVSGHAYLAGP